MKDESNDHRVFREGAGRMVSTDLRKHLLEELEELDKALPDVPDGEEEPEPEEELSVDSKAELKRLRQVRKELRRATKRLRRL